MITPTIGRVVWFWPATHGGPKAEQPFAALVAYVHSDGLINIGYFDSNGNAGAGATRVLLLQDDDVPPDGGCFCSWMPFQLGQAKAQQAAEKQA